MKEQQKFAVVILAAGQGRRMGGESPKVLKLINGRPIIGHLVEAIKKSGICEKPAVIVCDEHTLVQDVLGDSCDYVIQAEQLGTGHAVACAEGFLKDKAEDVLVLYGDHGFLTAPTLQQLRKLHQDSAGVLTLMTTVLPDFEDWRFAFKSFGRIIRNEKGEIAGIVEKKDATGKELEITEVNPMYCCFKADWLWGNLKKINNKNAQGEYYLTDLIKIAFEQGRKTNSLKINNFECLGINNPEELDLANRFLSENNVE